MPDTTAPSPAYVAAVTPFDLHSAPMRRARLSGRQVRALRRLKVPVVLDPRSRLLPSDQAALAIQGTIEAILPGRRVAASLHQDEDAGDVSVWVGEWLTIADVELGLPAQAVAA